MVGRSYTLALARRSIVPNIKTEERLDTPMFWSTGVLGVTMIVSTTRSLRTSSFPKDASVQIPVLPDCLLFVQIKELTYLNTSCTKRKQLLMTGIDMFLHGMQKTTLAFPLLTHSHIHSVAGCNLFVVLMRKWVAMQSQWSGSKGNYKTKQVIEKNR